MSLGDYDHVTLGKSMAQALRERFGEDAIKAIPQCREKAAASGCQIQVDTVRMAEKWLTIWQMLRK